jgi:lipoprotein-releasing system permease protein
MKNLEYMLARRTASSEGGSRAVVMTRIAVSTVALGVAVMILALAVMTGFRHEVNSRLRGLMADVVVQDVTGLLASEAEPMPRDGELEELLSKSEGVRSVAPYTMASGMARSGDNVAALQLKGFGPEYDSLWWHSVLLEGHLPDVAASARSKSIVVSHTTARELGVGVGDKVEMLFFGDDERPRRDRFKVCGIYSSGLEEMERLVALADRRDVARLRGDADLVSGYDVSFAEASGLGAAYRQSDAEQEWLNALTESVAEYAAHSEDDFSPVAVGIAERYPVVFDWLKAHKVNAAVVVAIMLVVLLFNMTSALLIMVLDRRGMIGVLKAQGMRNGAIRAIFLYRSAILFVRGALWGNIVGLGLIAVQRIWHPIRLDASGYMLSVLPVELELWWWLLLNCGVAMLTVAAMIIPSAIVSRFSPAESLKYRA